MVDYQGVRDALQEATPSLAEASRQGNWPAIEHGQDTVTAAGTAEQLNGGTSIAIPDGAELVVTALPNNTGNVYVGDSDVDSTNGDVLTPDTSLSLPVTDVNIVYIDVDNDGEGVSWIVEVEG